MIIHYCQQTDGGQGLKSEESNLNASHSLLQPRPRSPPSATRRWAAMHRSSLPSSRPRTNACQGLQGGIPLTPRQKEPHLPRVKVKSLQSTLKTQVLRTHYLVSSTFTCSRSGAISPLSIAAYAARYVVYCMRLSIFDCYSTLSQRAICSATSLSAFILPNV